MAGLAGFKVISVDYRMPPDFPFPAALDDAFAVYRELVARAQQAAVPVIGLLQAGAPSTWNFTGFRQGLKNMGLHLRSRGASIKAAVGAAFSGRGRWFCANHPGLTRAYPPAWFSGKLVSLATRWDELNTNVQASGQLLLPL